MQFLEVSDADNEDMFRVHDLAFGRHDEAALVASLLRDPTAKPLLSVLAVVEGRGTGHALFTALSLTKTEQPVKCAILAPLAVLPSHQGTGIGRGLIEYGCKTLAERGVQLIFVLGDPRYYMRCGFQPAFALGLHAPYTIDPEEAWMVRALSANVLGTVTGTVRCAESLAAEHYWRE